MFTRLSNARRWKAGEQVGSHNKTLGYIVIGIERQWNWAHRLAWLYMTGEWPAGVIDHIDGDRANNRFSNLRDVPQRANMQNRKRPQKDNVLGLLGVSMRRGRFRATLKLASRQLHIGDFDTPEAAHQAYLEAKRLHHEGNTL